MPNTSHKFSGFGDWVEVFRSGNHTDSQGRVKDWTHAELDQMVANHSGGHTLPIVIGHPKTDAPAYGWGDQLKRVGDKLLAKFSQVQPAFEKMVKGGSFPNRSSKIIKTDKGYKLAHVGFLGAAPPAIEGLEPIQFSADAQGDVYEFAYEDAYSTSLLAAGMRSFRQFIADVFGQDKADQYAPEDRIAQLESLASQQLSETSQGDTNPEPSVDDSTASYSKWDAASRKELASGKRKGAFAGPNHTFPISDGEDVQHAWDLSGKAQDADAVRRKIIAIAKEYGLTDSLPATARQWAKDHSIEFSEAAPVKTYTEAEHNAALETERNKRLAAEQQTAEFLAKQKVTAAQLIVADLVKAGRLSPAQAEGVAEFMASVDDGAEFTFTAAADGKEAKKPRGDFFRTFLAALPVQMEFNKQRVTADGRIDTSKAESIVAAAREYQATQQQKGHTVEWHEAVAHVSKAAA